MRSRPDRRGFGGGGLLQHLRDDPGLAAHDAIRRVAPNAVHAIERHRHFAVT
jgi:hypothetical protein